MTFDFNNPIHWKKNPAYFGGDDPLMLAGDRMLVAIPHDEGHRFEVIRATEHCSFVDVNDDQWPFDWDDVEFYAALDGERTQEEIDALE